MIGLSMMVFFYVQYNFKLYRNKWFTVGLQLLMAFNAFFTIIILYTTTENRRIDALNTNSELYFQTTKPIFNDTYDMFDQNEHMNYFFDELFNGTVNPNAKRDEITEQIICFKLFSNVTSHAIFYYDHIDLVDFHENTKLQNIRVIQFLSVFIKQYRFKNYLKKYLQTFAGPKFIRFFKKFFEKEMNEIGV